MNIEKLIKTGRLIPIHEVDQKTQLTMLTGYRRRGNSRKANQQYKLRVPEPVVKQLAGTPLPGGQIPMPPAPHGAQDAGCQCGGHGIEVPVPAAG